MAVLHALRVEVMIMPTSLECAVFVLRFFMQEKTKSHTHTCALGASEISVWPAHLALHASTRLTLLRWFGGLHEPRLTRTHARLLSWAIACASKAYMAGRIIYVLSHYIKS
jgi:hypothetical protein